MGFEEDLIIPNPKLTLLEGAIAPWRTVKFSKYLRDLVRVAPELKLPLNTPFEKLSKFEKEIVFQGSKGFNWY